MIIKAAVPAEESDTRSECGKNAGTHVESEATCSQI